MRTLNRSSRLTAVALAVALTTGSVLTTTSANAAPTSSDSTVASGENWTVTDLGGMYQVTLDLDRPLEIRSDAPTLLVDGQAVGLATESPSGRTLTALTDDPSVLTAERVEAGWFSDAGASTVAVDPQDVDPAPEPGDIEDAPLGTPDPSVPGEYAYSKALYSFGNQAIELAGIGGIRGEVEGKIYLPETGGARPVVLFLHGRHTSCNGPGTNPARWPCLPTQTNIPSYAGYDGAAEALASHGYAVISIGANAINSNDNQLALDYGAQARGQLILDTLSIFRDASEGTSTTLYDAQTASDVTLADALADNDALPAAGLDDEIVELTPADLVGRLDFSRVGLMGHSRGGEGVTSAATLNAGLADPFDIVSILPLAPVDFGRMTTPDIPTMLLLPYCDGDVSSQQGQHMNDDSRYAFDDDVLRTDVWVMGANHNFFNTVWTPSKYSLSTSDDWSGTNATSARSTDSVCGTTGAAVDTTIRLTDDEQYDTGTTLMAGWFRLTVGGEEQFLPMFDGSGAKVESIKDFDIRVSATQPASARADIARFTTAGQARTYGTATATLCASMSGRAVPQVLPYCSTTLASAQLPHWTSVRFGGDVPASPMTRMQWTSGTGEIRVSVPRSARDASGHDFLTLKASPDESVAYGTGTDLTVTLVDGSGATFSTLVSALNPNALVRLPQSTQNPTTLGKIVLHEVRLPLDGVDIDLTDVREVRLKAAVGRGDSVSGGVYLTDLAFASSALGTASPATQVTVGTVPVRVEEGSGPDEALVPVRLSKPATTPVTAYVSVIGGTTATAKAGMQMRKVVFSPGQTCTTVPVATYGDAVASSAATTSYTISVTNTSNAVMGSDAFAPLVVREDDGVTSGTPAPAYGVQGDPCAELTATPGTLTPSTDEVGPGEALTVTGSGFRAAESVAFSLGGIEIGSALAAGDGTVSAELVVPDEATLGAAQLTALGAGSGRTATGAVSVLAPTSTQLTLAPEVPAILEPVTLTALVEGADTAGEVTFLDGETVLGTAEVVDGVATLELADGFAAGEHAVVATFAQTATAASSSSQTVTFLLTKGLSTIALALDASASVYGTPVTGQVTVEGSATGTVTLTYGSTTKKLALVDRRATVALPANLAPGRYTVGVTFDGTGKVAPSGTVTADLTVAKKATAVKATAPTSVTVGGKVSGTVTLSGATAGTTPGGRVTVQVKQGKGAWTTATTTTLRKGKATYTFTAPRSAVTLSVRAVYAGDARYASSTSSASAVSVVKKATTTSISVRTSASVGAAFTATVTVTPSSSTAGTAVKVYTKQPGGSWKLVSTATLNGKGKVGVPVSGRSAGTLQVKAVYAGTGTLAPSTGTASVRITR